MCVCARARAGMFLSKKHTFTIPYIYHALIFRTCVWFICYNRVITASHLRDCVLWLTLLVPRSESFSPRGPCLLPAESTLGGSVSSSVTVSCQRLASGGCLMVAAYSLATCVRCVCVWGGGVF